jgi:hypothetical protein
MNKLRACFALVVLTALGNGCVNEPRALSAIGPDPAAPLNCAFGGQGRLQVFSATQTRAADNSSADYNGYFYPHSSYEIQNDAGRTVKYIRNRANFMDETPDSVRLAPGHYQVVAESSCCGLVAVPVVIVAGQTTSVHLDAQWIPSARADRPLVRLPDGETAGFAAAAPTP